MGFSYKRRLDKQKAFYSAFTHFHFLNFFVSERLGGGGGESGA